MFLDIILLNHQFLRAILVKCHAGPKVPMTNANSVHIKCFVTCFRPRADTPRFCITNVLMLDYVGLTFATFSRDFTAWAHFFFSKVTKTNSRGLIWLFNFSKL